MNKRRQNKASTIFHKVVDDATSKAVTFVLSTALIGGSTYLLFQAPKERLEIEREIAKYTNAANQITESPLLEVIGIATSDAKSGYPISRRREAIWEVVKNTKVEQLDPTFTEQSLRWLTDTLMQLEIDRGRINGFLFTNDLERSLQQDIIGILDSQSAVLTQMSELILRWSAEQESTRAERLLTVAKLTQRDLGLIEQISSRTKQIIVAGQAKGRASEQTANELKGRSDALWLQQMLAFGGIVAGIGFIAWVVITAATKR